MAAKKLTIVENINSFKKHKFSTQINFNFFHVCWFQLSSNSIPRHPHDIESKFIDFFSTSTIIVRYTSWRMRNFVKYPVIKKLFSDLKKLSALVQSSWTRKYDFTTLLSSVSQTLLWTLKFFISLDSSFSHKAMFKWLWIFQSFSWDVRAIWLGWTNFN